MSLVKIKKALEQRLALLTPVLSTAYEAVSFQPVQSVPYQRVQVIAQTPDNNTLGQQHYKEQGQLQVFLCYPTNHGTGEVLARAELTRNWFARGTTLVEQEISVVVEGTPSIQGTVVVGDRVIVPVLVNWYAEVFGS